MSTISLGNETPTHGQQAITACAFIHHNFNGVEKVFLPKRAHTKKFLPDIYELPGGHIDFGEDIVSGLKREIREEFEMDVAIGDPFFVFTYMNEAKVAHYIEVIFFARFTTDLKYIALHPEDHSEYGWFGKDELEKAYMSSSAGNEQEFRAMRKGFAILAGEKLEV